MSNIEEFCLTWKDFKQNASTTFSQLRKNIDFSDVTLACEDGKQIEAHRVILAGSSPFFLNILQQNKHDHPLIYMRGIRMDHLVAMVDFMYSGEAKVPQQNIASFLSAADDLKLKGLHTSQEPTKEIDPAPLENGEIKKEPKSKTKSFMTTNNEPPPDSKPNIDNIRGEVVAIDNSDQMSLSQMSLSAYETAMNSWNEPETDMKLIETEIPVELQELEDKIKSMMSTCEERLTGGQSNQGKVRACNICGKKGTSTNIQSHIESNHISGINLPCKICNTSFNSRRLLRKHPCILDNFKKLVSSKADFMETENIFPQESAAQNETNKQNDTLETSIKISEDDLTLDPWNAPKPDVELEDKIEELDDKIRSIMTTTDEKLTGGQASQGYVRLCNVCGKKGTMTNIKYHIEAHHISGVDLPCDMCKQVFKTRFSLRKHKSKHVQ